MKQKRRNKRSRSVKAGGKRTAEFAPGNVKKIISQIEQLGRPICENYGLELINIDCRREQNGRIIRLYIDKPGGVALDDCVFVSKQMNDLVDIHLDIKSEYHLEVSSPGINRFLHKTHDFEKSIGKRVKIVTEEPIDGQRNFTGRLLDISRGTVMLKMNDRDAAIPFGRITKAQLVYEDGEI